jgi:hypothetical protein
MVGSDASVHRSPAMKAIRDVLDQFDHGGIPFQERGVVNMTGTATRILLLLAASLLCICVAGNVVVTGKLPQLISMHRPLSKVPQFFCTCCQLCLTT